MGRRSLHTPQELKHMIIKSARDILERGGISALSARAIATTIGYSPGTLYNVFKNIDDVISTIECALLQEASAALRSVPREGDPANHLRALAESYMGFALKNRRLWNLLFQQVPRQDSPNRAATSSILMELRNEFHNVVASIMADKDPAETKRLADSLWFTLYGLSGIAVSERDINCDPRLVASYVRTTVDGTIALATQANDTGTSCHSVGAKTTRALLANAR